MSLSNLLDKGNPANEPKSIIAILIGLLVGR